jgi:hypothetical protein
MLCKIENSISGKIAIELQLHNTKEIRNVISGVLRISGLMVFS